jgi:CheY-like chemotaxis protein
MPKMDGIEVLETLKKDELLKKIPVIMVTTSSDPKNIERCKELGCFGYVVKPLQNDFKALIQNI